MNRTLIILLALSSGLTAAGQGSFSSGYERQSPGVAWAADFDAAFRRAKQTDTPIMVFLTMNGDATNEEIARVTMRHPDVIRESRKFICLVSCPGDHGHKDGVCSRFGHVSCAAHARVEGRVRGELLQTASVQCPQWIFYAPDGKTVVLRHVWKLSAAELRDKMRRAAKLATKRGESGARDPMFDAMAKEAGGGHMGRRREALRGLMGIEDPRVVAFLNKTASGRSSRVRRLEAIMTMGEARQERFLPVLVALLRSKDGATRAHAAVALEKLADPDSSAPLLGALESEKRPEVRANLLRALMVCGEQPAILRGMKVLLKRGGKLDRLCAMWAASQVVPDETVKRAIGRFMKSSSGQLRAAAYLAAGAQGLDEWEGHISKRARSDRNLARTCGRWALEQFRGDGSVAADDPEELIRRLLPDEHLRRGELEKSRGSRR